MFLTRVLAAAGQCLAWVSENADMSVWTRPQG